MPAETATQIGGFIVVDGKKIKGKFRVSGWIEYRPLATDRGRYNAFRGIHT
jgi:hypothetical protein